jgi:hypothetical protein
MGGCLLWLGLWLDFAVFTFVFVKPKPPCHGGNIHSTIVIVISSLEVAARTRPVVVVVVN